MATDDWCRCWRTKWQYEHMTDDKGMCKHCGRKVAFFFMHSKKGKQRTN